MNKSPNSIGDPSKILQVSFGFWSSKVILTAAKLELFTLLSNSPLTSKEIGEKLGLHERGTYDFFDCLLSLGFLDRDGDGPHAKYKNTTDTETFLVKNKPNYIGGILEMINERQYKFWGDLEDGLKTGKPQNEVKSGGKGIFEKLYSDPILLNQFMHAMTGLSIPNFTGLCEKFDFSTHQTFCDVGGALGVLSEMLVNKYPHLNGSTFDLPQVNPLATKYLQEKNVSHKVKVFSGNYLLDKLPSADVIIASQILHDLNLTNKMAFLKSVYQSLPNKGALIVVDAIIDDERRKNTFGLLMSLNMLIEFGDAFDYTFADFKGWCQQTGFKTFHKIPLNDSYSALIAYK